MWKRIEGLFDAAARNPAAAFSIAIPVAASVAVLVLWSAISGWPPLIKPGAFEAIAAWGVLASALVSALLALGAGLAAIGLRDQLRELTCQREIATEQLAEMRRQGKTATRPYLQIREAQVEPYSGDVILTVENIGPGPALDIKVRGWFTIDPGLPMPSVALEDFTSRSLDRLSTEAPHYRGDHDAIGASQRGSIELSGHHPPNPEGLGTQALYFLLLSVEHCDIYQTRFEIEAPARRWVTAQEPWTGKYEDKR